MTGAHIGCVYVVRERCPVQQRLEGRFQQHRLRILWLAAAGECLEALREEIFGPLIVGLDGEPERGLQLISRWSQMDPQTPTIAIVNKGDVPLAVKATRAGAQECVERPLNQEWWLTTADAILSQQTMDSRRTHGSLTDTEKLVLRHVVQGRTTREIAEILHRSPRTVDVHRLNILRKLGVSSTIELVTRGALVGGCRCEWMHP